jgi:hypothetical protein
LILLVILSSLITACATRNTPKYGWGNYNTDLYKYYAHTITQEDLARNLQVSIQQCEANGKVVPPGLYGEYGYLLYETGHYGEAVGFFQKEHDKWPESRVVMAKMIRNCNAKMTGHKDPKSPSDIEAAQQGTTPPTPIYLLVLKTANIREKANTKCKVVTTVKKGDQLEKMGQSGDWCKVKLPSGQTGWVSINLVKEGARTTPSQPSAAEDYKAGKDAPLNKQE